MTPRRGAAWVVLVAVAAVAGYAAWRWHDGLPVLPALRASPHEAYARALERAGLADASLTRAWRKAAAEAVDAPLDARTAFTEVVSFPPDAPHAIGYRFALERGQRLRVVAEPERPGATRVFIDLFEVQDEATRVVASAESGATSLDHEIRRGATFVLRVQPELLYGGRVRITQRVDGALTFPVHERGTPAVKSHFGAPRDGGRREHHGVDIFAPRGTPVLAAAGGVVSNVGTNRLGGNVVWVWDVRRMQSHYYAHLDEQRATTGQRVSAGEVIGTVGNSGNARTTPPHLHFGIYAADEGPIDPFPFVAPGTEPAPLVAPLDVLGSWGRPARPPASLRRGADGATDVVARLPRDAVFRVIGTTERAHRVRAVDGLEGYLDADALALAAPPWSGFAREGDAVADPLIP